MMKILDQKMLVVQGVMERITGDSARVFDLGSWVAIFGRGLERDGLQAVRTVRRRLSR